MNMWIVLRRKDGFERREWGSIHKWSPQINMFERKNRIFKFDPNNDPSVDGQTVDRISFVFKEWVGDIAIYEEM